MTDKLTRSEIYKKRNNAIKAKCLEAGYTSASNFWTAILKGEVNLPVNPKAVSNE